MTENGAESAVLENFSDFLGNFLLINAIKVNLLVYRVLEKIFVFFFEKLFRKTAIKTKNGYIVVFHGAEGDAKVFDP